MVVAYDYTYIYKKSRDFGHYVKGYLRKCNRKLNMVFPEIMHPKNNVSVAVAWAVESLPSNPAARVRFPAGLGILISVLGLGVCPLPVFCPVLSSAEALTLC